RTTTLQPPTNHHTRDFTISTSYPLHPPPFTLTKMSFNDEILDIPIRRSWCVSPWDDIVDDVLEKIICVNADIDQVIERNNPMAKSAFELEYERVQAQWDARLADEPEDQPEDERADEPADERADKPEEEPESEPEPKPETDPITDLQFSEDYQSSDDHRSDSESEAKKKHTAGTRSRRGTAHTPAGNGERAQDSENTAGSAVFTCFSRLPAEIREQIWLATESPHVIRMHALWTSDSRSRLQFCLPVNEYSRRYAEISLYQPINREVRAIALRAFGTPSRGGIPFNPRTDSVEIEGHMYHLQCEEDVSTHWDEHGDPDHQPRVWTWDTRDKNCDCADERCCPPSSSIDTAHIIVEKVIREHYPKRHAASQDLVSRMRLIEIVFSDGIFSFMETHATPGLLQMQSFQRHFATLIVAAFPRAEEIRLVTSPLDDSALLGRAGYQPERHSAIDWTRWCLWEALRGLGKVEKGRNGSRIPFRHLKRILVVERKTWITVEHTDELYKQKVVLDEDGRSTEPLSAGNTLMYCERGKMGKTLDDMMIENRPVQVEEEEDEGGGEEDEEVAGEDDWLVWALNNQI
ncbi:hypothetical protein QBC39DRAFT_398253, partial [Podospora conica]